MRALLAIALLAVGCGSSSAEDQREQARPYITISATVSKTELLPGETAKVQVFLMRDDGTGDPVGGDFQSNNDEVATVDEAGLVRAVAKGTTSVRAAYGSASTYVAITVK